MHESRRQWRTEDMRSLECRQWLTSCPNLDAGTWTPFSKSSTHPSLLRHLLGSLSFLFANWTVIFMLNFSCTVLGNHYFQQGEQSLQIQPPPLQLQVYGFRYLLPGCAMFPWWSFPTFCSCDYESPSSWFLSLPFLGTSWSLRQGHLYTGFVPTTSSNWKLVLYSSRLAQCCSRNQIQVSLV